MRILPIFNQQ